MSKAGKQIREVNHDTRRRNAAQAGLAAVAPGAADRLNSDCLSITLNGRTMAVVTFPGCTGTAAVGRALISLGQFVDEQSFAHPGGHS